ncbi:hypothetical protein [Streptomyces sp. NPDC005181]|uniref:hypothetical protein n=1 Tax=Streptomyces sp. NPDC005181 TaxID=3156869 RepID=UPI0033B0FB7E
MLSWIGWCSEYGYNGPQEMTVGLLIARREVHLREKTLGRMLYETAARAEEILGVDIDDLDFAGRRCPVKAKGVRSKARRRG